MTSASDLPPATAGPPAASASAPPSDGLFADAVSDLTALALIYWNPEARVAHFLFR